MLNRTVLGLGWQAVSSKPEWIIIDNATGSGNGRIYYSVLPNRGVGRNGAINIGKASYSITQSEGCVYTISTTASGLLDKTGGTGNFIVSVSATTCEWQLNPPSWVTITGIATIAPISSGVAESRQVSYSVGDNSSNPPREGNINVSAQTGDVRASYTVSQDGLNCQQACLNAAQRCQVQSQGAAAMCFSQCVASTPYCNYAPGACTQYCSAQCQGAAQTTICDSQYNTCINSCQ